MSLEGCRHGPTSLGFGPGCTQCRDDDADLAIEEGSALAQVNATLRRLTDERLQREAEHQAAWRESVKLLSGFTEVRLEVVVGGDGFVRLYECDKCAALVRPLAEAQTRHKLDGCS